MYTQDELRDMLQARDHRLNEADTTRTTSAGLRADALALNLLPRDRPRRRGTRLLAPLAVAATVAAVAGGVVAVTSSGGSRSQPAAGSGSSASSAPSTNAASTSPTVPARSSAHRALTPVIDAVTVRTANSTENNVGAEGADEHGQQDVISQLPGGRAINLVIAAAAGFDGSHVSHSHPVAIAGTTGYYDVLRLFPLADGGRGGSAPTGTIVFHTPDGHWAFAWLQAGTKNGTQQGTPVDDPSAIVKGYDTLHATYVAGRFRTPFKVGYLPAGTRFDSADETTTSAPGVRYPGLIFTGGSREINISLSPTAGSPQDDGQNCRIKILHMCTTSYHRNLAGGGQVVVDGIGYSKAETQKVLDHLEVASDLADRSTYFTLADAIG